VSDHAAKFRAQVTPWRFHAALTVLGVSGIALNFVSFAAGYVPIRDAFPGGFLAPSWWSVLPCMLLPLPVAIGYAFWLARGPLPGWYRRSAYILAVTLVAPFLAGTVFDFFSDGLEIVFPVLFVAAFCAAAGLVIWGSGRDNDLNGLIAMQAVYLVQMQFWLILGSGQFQLGAWLGVTTSLAYLLQIKLVVQRRAWPLVLLLLLPGAALTIVLLTE